MGVTLIIEFIIQQYQGTVTAWLTGATRRSTVPPGEAGRPTLHHGVPVPQGPCLPIQPPLRNRVSADALDMQETRDEQTRRLWRCLFSVSLRNSSAVDVARALCSGDEFGICTRWWPDDQAPPFRMRRALSNRSSMAQQATMWAGLSIVLAILTVLE